MIFTFFNKHKLLVKRKKQLFTYSPYYWFNFLIYNKFITILISKKHIITQKTYIYSFFYNSIDIFNNNKYKSVNLYKNKFIHLFHFINLNRYNDYFNYIKKIIIFIIVFSLKNPNQQLIVSSVYSINIYRLLKSNILQNKEFAVYRSGSFLQINHVFLIHQQSTNLFRYSRKIYIKKRKKLLKQKNLIIKYDNNKKRSLKPKLKKVNKWFNIQINTLLTSFKLKKETINFPYKNSYNFKKYRKTKKKVLFVHSSKKPKYFKFKKNIKLKKKAYLNLYNKYFYIYYIQNFVFPSVDKHIIQKRDFNKIYSCIKSFKGKKILKVKKRLYKTKKKTIEVSYKNYQNNKIKHLVPFTKYSTDNWLKSWKIQKPVLILLLKKCQKWFFFKIFYHFFKHNQIKRIYTNNWKDRSFLEWIWLSKNIKKIKYKVVVIKRNKNKFIYYNFLLLKLLSKTQNKSYIKLNYTNNLLSLYKKQIMSNRLKNKKKRIVNIYSIKQRNSKKIYHNINTAERVAVNNAKIKKSTNNKKSFINKNQLFFKTASKNNFYFKSLAHPHKPLNNFNFTKIKNRLSLLLNNRISLYYINVISLTRLAFDDRAKKYSVKYRAFVLKYSIIPRSFILNEIVKVKTSNIYLKKLIRNIERRYIYVAIFIKDIVRITFFCRFLKKTTFLANFYAYAFSKLTRKYKETVFIRFLIKILKSATINRKEIIGIRFRFKGRINRWRRTKYIVGQKGIWNYNSISTVVDYAQSSAVTKKGRQGISIWLCYKANFILSLRSTFIDYISLSTKKLNI